MGGSPKGFLRGPTGAPLVVRLADVALRAGCEAVLVGAHVDAYATLGLPMLADDPPSIGPVGGLRALVAAAGARDAIALACDMPHVDERSFRILLDVPLAADVLAPRGASGLWEPFFARYRPCVLPKIEHAVARGSHSLQSLFASLDVQALLLDPGGERVLEDWDHPSDVVTKR
jgi:molybdopterin-guanine dinucleotide biosynthesis protein A